MLSAENLPLPDDNPDNGKQIVTWNSEIGGPINDEIDWDTDDELELEYCEATDNVGMSSGRGSHVYYLDAASSSESSTSNSNKVDHFVAMGFEKQMVIQAIKENGEENVDDVLNSLLTYSALGNSPATDPSSSKLCLSSGEDSMDDLSDDDSACEKVRGGSSSFIHTDHTIALLVDMGYRLEDAVSAVEKCGSDAPVDVLTDSISAAEMFKKPASDLRGLSTLCVRNKKRKFVDARSYSKKPIKQVKRVMDDDSLHIPKPMIGFGAPGFAPRMSYREIPPEAAGPPFFYYENVALTPKGVWQQITRFLYGIEPEFVDSIHFSAAARKRGYIHNLPIENRKPLLPIPPKTIHEALPDTRQWWPSWDKRTKLNCLLTCIGSAQLTDRIRKRVDSGTPSDDDKNFVMQQCKKWNLVWVGKNKVAVLEPEEMEYLLGFPRYHTRGGGIGRVDRYKVLGNSFQIDTVGYHLSVLKPLYPNGMNVLSLFSGIGGAEVALDRVGIPLNNVVSVEISPASRQILQDWWDQTGQRGRLIHVEDVEKVDRHMIEHWNDELNGFDLVIGGSPCNNLAGGNRWTRDGLEGEQSSLFYQYFRILECVRSLMKQRRGCP